jgi:hypothetical protein
LPRRHGREQANERCESPPESGMGLHSSEACASTLIVG